MALKPEVQESCEVEVQRPVTKTIPKRIVVGGWLVIEVTDEPWIGSEEAAIPQHFALMVKPPSGRLTSDELTSASEAFGLAAQAQEDYDKALAAGQVIR